MKEYKPEQMVAINRYQNYFPTMPVGTRNDSYQRMNELIEEEKVCVCRESRTDFDAHIRAAVREWMDE